MIQTDKHLVGAETYPTQHAMLIAWGHFARTIGLLEQVSQVPIAQKTISHPPHKKAYNRVSSNASNGWPNGAIRAPRKNSRWRCKRNGWRD